MDACHFMKHNLMVFPRYLKNHRTFETNDTCLLTTHFLRGQYEPDPEDDDKIASLTVIARSKLEKQLQELERHALSLADRASLFHQHTCTTRFSRLLPNTNAIIHAIAALGVPS